MIDGSSEADIVIVRNHRNSAAGLPRAPYSLPSAIIYHHYFKFRERLALQGGEATSENFVRRQGRNNHGHCWVDLAGPRFACHLRLCVAAKELAHNGLASARPVADVPLKFPAAQCGLCAYKPPAKTSAHT